MFFFCFSFLLTESSKTETKLILDFPLLRHLHKVFFVLLFFAPILFCFVRRRHYVFTVSTNRWFLFLNLNTILFYIHTLNTNTHIFDSFFVFWEEESSLLQMWFRCIVWMFSALFCKSFFSTALKWWTFNTILWLDFCVSVLFVLYTLFVKQNGVVGLFYKWWNLNCCSLTNSFVLLFKFQLIKAILFQFFLFSFLYHLHLFFLNLTSFACVSLCHLRLWFGLTGVPKTKYIKNILCFRLNIEMK